MKLSVPALSVGMILMLQAAATLAATPAELQQIERIQQEEQQRQQRQLDLDRSRARPPVNLQPATPARPASRPDGPCREVREIHLNGASLLLNTTQDKLVAPYVGRCLNVNDIERLMGEVTAHYMNAGYITARVYLGAQDLSTGRLELTVVEGLLERLRIEDGGTGSVSRFNAFPAMTGKPLNLRDVEQGLDQLNRLASNNATMSIEPGTAPGDSVLVVTNPDARRWRVNASVDSYGSKSTGLGQAATGVSVDNPLGFDDFASFSDRRSVDRDNKRRNSVADSLSYSIPFGYLLLSAGTSHSTYTTTFQTNSGLDSRADGDSLLTYVRADQVVWRDKVNLLTLSGTLTSKDTKSYIGGQLLDVSSRKLSVGDVDLSLRTRLGGGVLFLGAGVSRGLKMFGALEDMANLPDNAPRAQFTKGRLSANWSNQFPLGERTVDLSSSLSGQLSRDVLYGSEQLLIGSVFSVRGFRDNSLANDNGWMLRNEVGARTPFEAFGMSGSWRVYAGLDAGYVRGRAWEGQRGTLVGAATGFQTKLGPVSLDTFFMAPVHRPAGFTSDDGTLQAWLSVAY